MDEPSPALGEGAQGLDFIGPAAAAAEAQAGITREGHSTATVTEPGGRGAQFLEPRRE